MREIKFRAWQKKNKKMIYLDDKQEWRFRKDFWCLVNLPFRLQICGPEGSELMQFTGLKDKKRTKEYPDGQPIYEGDIVRYTHKALERPVDYEVVYYDGCYAQRRLDTKMEDMPNEASDSIWNYWNQLEVIDNIHENPELLKEKE